MVAERDLRRRHHRSYQESLTTPLESPTESLPVIDIASHDVGRIGEALDRACCEYGFFYVTGHNVSPALSARLMTLAREFFASPLQHKMRIAMAHGGARGADIFRSMVS